MKQYYTIQDVEDHLRDVRQEYKDLYRQYIEAKDFKTSQDLFIDLLQLRDYYNRIKLKLNENSLSFYYLN